MNGYSRNSLFNLLVRWAVLALGVALAARLISGISYDNGVTLLIVAILLGFCNAVLRPVLLLFTLPFIILSLGFGVLIVNALLFYFVGKIVDGFTVASFWSALGGSIIVSVTSMVMNSVLGSPRRRSVTPPPPPKRDDVIDI
jgi:putative membrane protein